MNQPKRQTSFKNFTWLFPAVLVAAAWWLLTRPYHGLWHDGVFYAAQALKHLHPEYYAHDVFFMYGSQDDFTQFSSLQAWLTSILGMQRTFILMYVVGAALWLYALIGLMGRWLSGIQLAASLILVLCLDSHYGGGGLFSYGEGFATPRIFSEALVLLSLSWWLGGRRMLALFGVAFAALLHPMIALAGIGVIGWAILEKLPIRAVVLWGALLVMGLLAMQLLVWTSLSPQLDPLWRHLIVQRSPYVFPYLWSLSDWLRVILDAMLLWLISRFVKGEAGKLAKWVLTVFSLAMLAALAAGAMDVQLALAAQIHRVQWLAHMLALALTVPLVFQLWQTASIWNRLLAVGAASSLALSSNYGGLLLPSIYILCWLAGYRFHDAKPNQGLMLILLGAIPLMASFHIATSLAGILTYSDQSAWLILLAQAPVALWVLFFGQAVSKRLRMGRHWIWAYGALALVAGILNWDSSSPWNNYDLPERSVAIAPVQALIPKDAVVYWESTQYLDPTKGSVFLKNIDRTWLWLKRSHYASITQAASGLFYRQTAVEVARRVEHLRRWGFRDANLAWLEHNKVPRKLELTVERLRGVCGDPVLKYVITDTELPTASLNFLDPATGKKFAVYDCAAIGAR